VWQEEEAHMAGTKAYSVSDFFRRFSIFVGMTPEEKRQLILANGLAKQAITGMCMTGVPLWEKFCDRSDRSGFLAHYGGFTPCDTCKRAFQNCLSALFA
jgi:hypothetical protein